MILPGEVIQTVRVLAQSPHDTVQVATTLMGEIRDLIESLLDESIEILDSKGNPIARFDGEEAALLRAEAVSKFITDFLAELDKP